MYTVELVTTSEIPPDVRQATERIRFEMRRVTEGIIAIGQNLALIKERLPHGEFLPYIKRELGMSARTAERNMHIAATVAGNAKLAIVADLDLPLRVLDLLTQRHAVASGAAEQVVEQLADGTTAATVKDVREALALAEQERDEYRTDMLDSEARRAKAEQQLQAKKRELAEWEKRAAGEVFDAAVVRAQFREQCLLLNWGLNALLEKVPSIVEASVFEHQERVLLESVVQRLRMATEAWERLLPGNTTDANTYGATVVDAD